MLLRLGGGAVTAVALGLRMRVLLGCSTCIVAAAAEENKGTKLGELFADLDAICRAAGDLWCPEAEKRLFAYAGLEA